VEFKRVHAVTSLPAPVKKAEQCPMSSVARSLDVIKVLISQFIYIAQFIICCRVISQILSTDTV
jgi:hypothetical protein